jgi:hypothetical protein
MLDIFDENDYEFAERKCATGQLAGLWKIVHEWVYVSVGAPGIEPGLASKDTIHTSNPQMAECHTYAGGPIIDKILQCPK